MPDRIYRLAFTENRFSLAELTAFEEQRFFIYAVGETTEQPSPGDGQPKNGFFKFTRRLIFLKPSTFVVDDLIIRSSSPGSVSWRLNSLQAPEISGLSLFSGKDEKLTCQTILPENPALQGMGLAILLSKVYSLVCESG
ncbi:MAG: hypothetical protein U0V70_06485 [Terriglobia bacterium]